MLCCCTGPGADSLVVPQPKIARRPSLFEALDELDLRNILADPADRVHLRRWAHRFSCISPIDFLIELSELLEVIESKSDKRDEMAARFARTYLAKDSASTVCHDISDGLLRKMIDALSFSSVDSVSILSQAKVTMLRFVRSDILGRFKESEDFKAMRNLHPRYVLAMENVREAFLETVDEAKKDAVLFWHSACELQEKQAALNREGDQLLRRSAFMDSAKSQLEGLGLERASPLHEGMSSTIRSSMRKVQDLALAGFVEAYVDFIVGPLGRGLILKVDPDPEVEICIDTLSQPVGADTLASDENEYDYASQW